MGRLFRQANTEETTVYYFGVEVEGEERDWIRVRASISNAEAHQLMEHAPTGERDLKSGFEFIERVFDKVVIDWSLTAEDGTPLQATVENIRTMDAAGARLIEDKIAEHLGKLLGREVEKLEGESST